MGNVFRWSYFADECSYALKNNNIVKIRYSFSSIAPLALVLVPYIKSLRGFLPPYFL